MSSGDSNGVRRDRSGLVQVALQGYSPAAPALRDFVEAGGWTSFKDPFSAVSAKKKRLRVTVDCPKLDDISLFVHSKLLNILKILRSLEG